MPAESSETADTEPPGRRRLTSLVPAALWPWRQATDERDRWILWVPVFIGAGVAGYFGLAYEPPIWLGAAALAGAVILRVVLRRWPPAATAATCLALAFLGLAAAQLRVALVSAPLLTREIGRAEIEGRVCEADLQPHGSRLYLDDVAIAGVAPEATPRRVRVRIVKEVSPDQLGQRIRITALALKPVSAPVAPGAFDFQRDTFFARIGAAGFSIEAPTPIAPAPVDAWLRSLPCRLSALRLSIGERIRAALPGDAGASAWR
jgi:competence protein ComEC